MHLKQLPLSVFIGGGDCHPALICLSFLSIHRRNANPAVRTAQISSVARLMVIADFIAKSAGSILKFFIHPRTKLLSVQCSLISIHSESYKLNRKKRCRTFQVLSYQIGIQKSCKQIFDDHIVVPP